MMRSSDALDLEAYEKFEPMARRTERVLDDTYGPKSPTKKRRKLPGKRKWKNKNQQHKMIRAQLARERYNKRSKAQRAFGRMNKGVGINSF